MKYGIIINKKDYQNLTEIAKLSFDYFELNFADYAKYSEEEYQENKAKVLATGKEIHAMCGFMPGNLKVVGDEIDYDAIKAYLETGLKRAKELGVKKVVFGSQAARNVPDGFDREKAYRQLIKFLQEYGSPIAKKNDIILVIEPLFTVDCNIINTVKEGIKLAKDSGCENVKGLADCYHMAMNGDLIENIKGEDGKIYHSHIARPDETRAYPKASDNAYYYEYLSYLKAVGCESCSIEGKTTDIVADAKEAIDYLKSLGL